MYPCRSTSRSYSFSTPNRCSPPTHQSLPCRGVYPTCWSARANPNAISARPPGHSVEFTPPSATPFTWDIPPPVSTAMGANDPLLSNRRSPIAFATFPCPTAALFPSTCVLVGDVSLLRGCSLPAPLAADDASPTPYYTTTAVPDFRGCSCLAAAVVIAAATALVDIGTASWVCAGRPAFPPSRYLQKSSSSSVTAAFTFSLSNLSAIAAMVSGVRLPSAPPATLPSSACSTASCIVASCYSIW